MRQIAVRARRLRLVLVLQPARMRTPPTDVIVRPAQGTLVNRYANLAFTFIVNPYGGATVVGIIVAFLMYVTHRPCQHLHLLVGIIELLLKRQQLTPLIQITVLLKEIAWLNAPQVILLLIQA